MHRTGRAGELLWECDSPLFAILLWLAVNSANILKGTAADKRMIAALMQWSGFLFPAFEPKTYPAPNVSFLAPKELETYILPGGGRNDGC